MAEAIDIRELNIRIEQQSAFVANLVNGMNQVIVGQKHLIDSLLIGLLSDGHILLEGVPGLAKTLAIKTLSQLIDSDYSRIQFTPDLLPADVIGTMIYSQKDVRVRTGAWRIIGTAQTVKVKEGETLAQISRRYLGPDMECYIEVYNNITASTPLKAGQEIKIPQLKHKKSK